MRRLRLRQRFFVLWTARLALLVLSFQIGAFDHHVPFTGVRGVEGSDLHVVHCHGEAGSCAASFGSVTALVGADYNLQPPAAFRFELPLAHIVAQAPALEVDVEPPRI
jgi:hypothetical protein